jgi:hypothetical protein
MPSNGDCAVHGSYCAIQFPGYSLDWILLVWNPSGIEETPMKAYLIAGLLVLGLTARAQTPAEAVAHAPDGGTITRIQSIAVLPLTNASFSATVTTEWTRILADGSTATLKNHRTIARDSTGRIFEERRSFTPTGDVQPTQIDALEYSDPNRHEFYSCIPLRRTCYASNYPRPAMASMPAGMDGLQLCGCASAQRAYRSRTKRWGRRPSKTST